VKIFTAPPSPTAKEDIHLIAVFGSGLVGGAVFDALFQADATLVQQAPTDWSRQSAVQDALSLVCDSAIRRSKGAASGRVSVVWAAGAAGFHSPISTHQQEFEHFKAALSAGQRVPELGAGWKAFFFHVSSAGGLFEGQRNVGLWSMPAPERDYGRFKLLQEQALESSRGFEASVVYRPSTVYGFSPNGRIGLISALLSNGIRHRVSYLSGSATTLRDYVFNRDVGRFIASELLAPLVASGHTKRFLVSGKPSSIQEIQKIAEELLRSKLYLNYTLGPQNASHNTYQSSAKARGFSITSLREGIQATFRDFLQLNLGKLEKARHT
jgi:UDP-glucose 4-epimerase